MNRRNTGLAVTLAVAGSLILGTPSALSAPLTDPVGGSAFGSSESPALPATPVLASVDNFRDIAGSGDGYEGIGGLHLNRGVFYRANALTAGDDDLATLNTLGITRVYDLRAAMEIEGREDRVPDGATRTWLPTESPAIQNVYTQVKTPADAVAFMQTMNRLFVTDAQLRTSFTALFNDLAATPGAQIIHCTSGKDRTGWASAILQTLAGVSPQTVMSDYLLTNEYSAASIDTQLAGIAAAKGPEAAAISAPILRVDASYLQAGLTQLQVSYGSVYNYLLSGLGLSLTTIAALLTKLVG